MERPEDLYSRVDERDNESPRSCHILALTFAGLGIKIPEDVKSAVMNSADESKRTELGETIDTVNLFAGSSAPKMRSNNFWDLATKIAASFGIWDPEYAQRRLDALIASLSNDDLEEGVGFTE